MSAYFLNGHYRITTRGERSERVIRAIRRCSIIVPPSPTQTRLAARVEGENRRGGEPGGGDRAASWHEREPDLRLEKMLCRRDLSWPRTASFRSRSRRRRVRPLSYRRPASELPAKIHPASSRSCFATARDCAATRPLAIERFAGC